MRKAARAASAAAVKGDDGRRGDAAKRGDAAGPRLLASPRRDAWHADPGECELDCGDAASDCERADFGVEMIGEIREESSAYSAAAAQEPSSPIALGGCAAPNGEELCWL